MTVRRNDCNDGLKKKKKTTVKKIIINGTVDIFVMTFSQ